MPQSCSPRCSSIQAHRRRLEMLRDMAAADATALESIAGEAQGLPSDQDEYVADFVKETPDALHRVVGHLDLYSDVIEEQLDRLYR